MLTISHIMRDSQFRSQFGTATGGKQLNSWSEPRISDEFLDRCATRSMKQSASI